MSLNCHFLCVLGDRDPINLLLVHGGGVAWCCSAQPWRGGVLCERCVSGIGVCCGTVCGCIRGMGVTVGWVELDRGISYHHPLLLQRVASCPGWMEELLASTGSRTQDQLAPTGECWTAAGTQWCLCHLFSGQHQVWIRAATNDSFHNWLICRLITTINRLVLIKRPIYFKKTKKLFHILLNFVLQSCVNWRLWILNLL